MKFYSTNKNSPTVSFQEALLTGQPPDGGLYMPVELPNYYQTKQQQITDEWLHFTVDIATSLLRDEIPGDQLQRLLRQAYSFRPIIKKLDERTFCLELFHGPTFSFKDFGAQFMAKTMGYFNQEKSRQLTILVATSGDTGSAVAHAFHNIDGIRVVMLYPADKVSPLQEKQLTTLGGNIVVLEVDGTFDDCQALVKKAFKDRKLREKLVITSANSINVGRLIPQSFYYGWAVSNLCKQGLPEMIVCVPSGNFGNLTGGLFAREMGLPVRRFVAAVNSNLVIPEYLRTGQYRPRPSIRTLSNAMDVGNPSNWARILELFNNDVAAIREHIWSTSVSDEDTIRSMQRIFQKYQYMIDPHTAVGFEALKRFRKTVPEIRDVPALILSTAHPAKFHEIVSKALNCKVKIPSQLARVLEKTKKTIQIPADYKELVQILLSN